MSLQRATAFALVTTVLACGSSPEPIYYAMAPSHAVGPSPPGWAHLIELRRPALAGYLNRAEIVSRVVDYRLRVAGGESWSEPLGDMIGRLLGEDLADRLPGSIVFTESSPISASPDAVVAVDIQRFDMGDDGAVTLLVELTIEKPNHVALASRRVELHVHPSGGGTAALVGAMSELLGRLADELAVVLRSPAASARATE